MRATPSNIRRDESVIAIERLPIMLKAIELTPYVTLKEVCCGDFNWTLDKVECKSFEINALDISELTLAKRNIE
jgi:hypothetical protein